MYDRYTDYVLEIACWHVILTYVKYPVSFTHTNISNDYKKKNLSSTLQNFPGSEYVNIRCKSSQR